MHRVLMLPVVVFALSACHVGTSARTFAPATGPDGIYVDLRVSGGRVEGELLEVQDTALLVLRESRVTLVPLKAIRAGRFDQRGVLIWSGTVAKRTLSELRLLSRFPGGLAPRLREALLAAYGQTEPAVAP